MDDWLRRVAAAVGSDEELDGALGFAKGKLDIKPLGDRVIVQRAEAEEKTAGGILLPETAKDKPKEGKILAVGEGKVNDKGERMKMTLKVGDRVLFTSYAGTEVKYQGEEFLIMSENDVLAVIPSGGTER